MSIREARPEHSLRKNRFSEFRIAVVLPCYRSKDQVLTVLRNIEDYIDHIICIDDACPQKTGGFIKENFKDPRLAVLYNKKNLGVGGATIQGYRKALQLSCDIVIKLDSDGQMDPRDIPSLLSPLVSGKADYTKGNRFFDREHIREMPFPRIFGNAVLSFFSKFSTGYWGLIDPTNGFTAINSAALQRLRLESLSKRFFFETDVLFRLGLIRAVVVDVPLPARYGTEQSNLEIPRVILPFIGEHLRNSVKRVIFNYFLRDFSVASLELVFAVIFLGFGILFGGWAWYESYRTGIPATAGTVMLAAFPSFVGFQLFLSFLNYDIRLEPRVPLGLKSLLHTGALSSRDENQAVVERPKAQEAINRQKKTQG